MSFAGQTDPAGVAACVPSPMLVVHRQRKYHRRSRAGCTSCKKRHIRCDETKPTCSNCIQNALDCEYLDPFVNAKQPASAARAGEAPRFRRSAGSNPTSGTAVVLAPAVPGVHILIGYPIELSEASRRLFHLFTELAHDRVRLQSLGIGGPKDSFLIHKALSDPGYLHGALLVAGVNWVWKTKSMDTVHTAILHHKTEAYRYVNQQLAQPRRTRDEAVIATIASLALQEASFFTSSSGSLRATVTHLHGLQRVVDAFWGPIDLTQLTLFQRTMQMLISCLHRGEITNYSGSLFETDRFQPTPLCVFFMSLFPVADAFWWKQGITPVGRYFKLSCVAGFAEKDGLPTGEDDRKEWQKASLCSFMTCYLYLAMTLRRGVMSSYVMNWLIEEFLDEVDRLLKNALANTCHRGMWFMTILLGASAVASVEWSNDLEEAQVDVWRRASDQKIRMGSSVLGLGSWDAALELLKKMGWAEGFDGEEEIRQIWERAVLQDNAQASDGAARIGRGVASPSPASSSTY